MNVEPPVGVDRLLQAAVDSSYEIVIFTAAGSESYASKIIEHRLYGDSCKQIGPRYVRKDRASTGRILISTCVIFDDKMHRVLQKDNVVRVKPFTGDKQDSEIERLLSFFEIESGFEDLRDAAARMNESFVLD